MSAVQIRVGLPIDQMPEWLGSALQKRPRRFNSGSGLQAPVARAERHRSSKSADAGSNPVWSPTHSVCHGRVAQRMSADFLHRRMHVRIVSRSPTRRVNWAGAQRRLLSDRPAQPVRIVLSTLRQFRGHGVLGCVLGFQPRRVSSILTARTSRPSSSGPGCSPFKRGDAGSNPAGRTISPFV